MTLPPAVKKGLSCIILDTLDSQHTADSSDRQCESAEFCNSAANHCRMSLVLSLAVLTQSRNSIFNPHFIEEQ